MTNADSSTPTVQVKLRFFHFNVTFVLLDRSHTSEKTVSASRAAQAVVITSPGLVVEVLWTSIISNEELYRHTGKVPVDVLIRRRKRQWINHILRWNSLFQYSPRSMWRTVKKHRLLGRYRESWSIFWHPKNDDTRGCCSIYETTTTRC